MHGSQRIRAFACLWRWCLLAECLLLFCAATADGAYAPCDLEHGRSNTDRVEFDENANRNTLLFELPFHGAENEIKEITMRSNELNSSMLGEYFGLKFKNFILKAPYDLDAVQIDLIELIFTCISGSYRNTFQLYVTINDVNNKVPEFVGTPYKFSVKELLPIGSIVFEKIKAIDRDLPNRPNSQIAFSILKGPCSDYFEFPLQTRSSLTVTKQIHYDDFSKCNLTVQVEDHGIPKLSSTTTIEISVIDVDDNDPQFTSKYYSGLINRNSPPGTPVNMTSDKISARDMDFGINMTLVYALTSNQGNMFEIDPKSGRLKLRNVIYDYDKMEYNLMITATQVDNQMKSAFAMVNIIVIDTNEYPPRFVNKTIEAELTENATAGTYIATVHAVDKDRNRIEYSIVNGNAGPFKIDKYQGVIKLNGRLDYHSQRAYKLEVQAYDGNFSDTAYVTINVVNVIDKAPYFEKPVYNFKLELKEEMNLLNLFIGQVKAVDVEMTGKLNYSLRFDNAVDSKLFCVTNIGVIYICSIGKAVKAVGDEPSTVYGDHIESLFNKSEYRFEVVANINSVNKTAELSSTAQCKVDIINNKHAKANLTAISSLTLPPFLIKYLTTASLNGLISSSAPTGSSSPSPKDLAESSPLSSTQAPSSVSSNAFGATKKDRFFKNSTALYVFIGAVSSTIFILTIVAFALIIYRCRQAKNIMTKLNKNNHSNLSDPDNYFYYGNSDSSRHGSKKHQKPLSKQFTFKNGLSIASISKTIGLNFDGGDSHGHKKFSTPPSAGVGYNFSNIQEENESDVLASRSFTSPINNADIVTPEYQLKLGDINLSGVERDKDIHGGKMSSVGVSENYLQWEEKFGENEIMYFTNAHQQIDQHQKASSSNYLNPTNFIKSRPEPDQDHTYDLTLREGAQPTIIVSSLASGSSCAGSSSSSRAGLCESSETSISMSGSTASTITNHKHGLFAFRRHNESSESSSCAKKTPPPPLPITDHFHLNDKLSEFESYTNIDKEVIVNPLNANFILLNKSDQPKPHAEQHTHSTFKVAQQANNSINSTSVSYCLPKQKRGAQNKNQASARDLKPARDGNAQRFSQRNQEPQKRVRNSKTAASSHLLHIARNKPAGSQSSSSSSASTASTDSTSGSTKKLLSFNPIYLSPKYRVDKDGGLMVFNNQEPLSVHSETNFVNDVVKTEKFSIYEDITTHMTTQSSSTTSPVSSSAESAAEPPHTHLTKINLRRHQMAVNNHSMLANASNNYASLDQTSTNVYSGDVDYPSPYFDDDDDDQDRTQEQQFSSSISFDLVNPNDLNHCESDLGGLRDVNFITGINTSTCCDNVNDGETMDTKDGHGCSKTTTPLSYQATTTTTHHHHHHHHHLHDQQQVYAEINEQLYYYCTADVNGDHANKQAAHQAASASGDQLNQSAQLNVIDDDQYEHKHIIIYRYLGREGSSTEMHV